jgi:hypothetical protein
MNFLAKKRLFSNLPANLITKQLLTTNLHRYDNCTSGVDLVSAGLKYSARGPQSIAEQNTDISLNHRDIHPSFMGIIDVFTNSNSDPGLTGCFNPFVHIDKNMFFSDKIAALTEDDLAED